MRNSFGALRKLHVGTGNFFTELVILNLASSKKENKKMF
jgi:hypothetical protein